MAEQDYCQYIISKCAAKVCSPATDGIFRTTKAFLDSYENSQSFLVSARVRDQRILEWAAEVVDEQIYESADLGPDAKKLLSRCQRKVKEIRTYEELFTVLSDFLWIMASRKSSENRKTTLIDDSIRERTLATAWITEWEEDIKNAQYDLDCMNEAEHLPISKQIFSGLISNPDVAKYVNREYISYEDFKQRIVACQTYIMKRQQLYYAFMATVIYREDLMRRYR
mgnify:CR=1 FL=1